MNSESLQKEYQKLISRNEELIKQDSTLRKEYTTMLRKASSLIGVIENLPNSGESTGTDDIENSNVGGYDDEKGNDKPKLISEEALKKIPELEWYNRQINLINDKFNGEEEDIALPEELLDTFKLYKDTALLYKDSHEPPLYKQQS